MIAGSTRRDLQLSVVLCQYDRSGYAGALERLIALLERMDSVRYRVVVVDNANPGEWHHEVTEGLFHIGGDNSNREFSAFDRGIEFLREAQLPSDVIALATDAYRAYGEEFLDLIDGDTLRWCLELDAGIGWIDSFGETVEALEYSYDWWIRTSLVFLPAARVTSVTPIALPLDSSRIFGSGSETPFAAEAPVSDNLRNLLLAWLTTAAVPAQREEVWHGQFDLVPETYDFFQTKVGAILREQLLSARLRRQGVECYDFRLVSTLSDQEIDAGSLTAEQRSQWQGLGFRSALNRHEVRYDFDCATVPQTVIHGDDDELLIVGWIVGEPRVESVRLRIGEDWVIEGDCRVSRPDVVRALGDKISNNEVGYEICAGLEGLTPGTHNVEWSVPGTATTRSFPPIQVLPRCEFHPRRVFVPDSARPGEEISISVEGSLESSHELARVELCWDDKPVGGEPTWAESGLQSSRLHRYEVSLVQKLPVDLESVRHTLLLRFHTVDGSTGSWRLVREIRATTTSPHVVTSYRVGAFDPMTERTEVQVIGAVLNPDGDSELALFVDDNLLLAEPLADSESGIVWFDLCREVAGIQPGDSEFALGLRSPRTELETLVRWRSSVELLRPRVTVDLCEVAAVPRSRPPFHVLRFAGWVEGHSLVDRMFLSISGEAFAQVEFNRLRSDVAKALGHPLIQQQGFATALEIHREPGEYTLELFASRAGGAPEKLWEGPIVLEKIEVGPLVIDSPVLRKFEGAETLTLRSSIAILGDIDAPEFEVRGRLFVDGELADEQEFPGVGAFGLRYVPSKSGYYTVRVLFEAGDKVFFDSGTTEIEFVAIEIPQAAADSLSRFLEAFLVDGDPGMGSAEDLARGLVERSPATWSEQFEMWGAIAEALAKGPGPEVDRPPVNEPPPERPLRVLFVSWEVPCLRHGGGVWMTNLLKELAQRHEITVIYCYGDGEEDWIEDLRPHVERTLGIRRRWTSSRASREQDELLGGLLSGCSVELRELIEFEALSGKYDLIDYQYLKMFPHLSKADIPSVLTLFEEDFTAALSRWPDSTGEVDRVADLDRLLKAFYLSALEIPRTVSNLIAVTEEDARTMRNYQNQARVYTNGIGIDASRFLPPTPREQGEGLACFTFLGNYRHPPSLDAALFCARQILPQLRRVAPDAKLTVVGAFPPPELEAMSGQGGIQVTNFVEDHRPYLWDAAAFLAPIFTGSGMRVKVLEAMASGVPVIGTALAMHGIGAEEGEHYFRAETLEEFVTACRRCIEDPAASREVGYRGRELVAAEHSNEARARERETIWRRVMADHAARGRAQDN